MPFRNWPVFTEAHAHASQEWNQLPPDVAYMPSNMQISPVSQTVSWFHLHLSQATRSDQLFTNAEDNHVRMLTGPFLQVVKCSSLLRSRKQVVHGPTALKHTSTIKLKHYGKLENVYKSRHMVISCILWKILFIFPTRDLNNHENGWLAHKHEQNPLLRPSLFGNSNHVAFLRWAATWCKEHQGASATSGTNNKDS